MIRKTTALTLLVSICSLISYAQTANFTAPVVSGCSPIVVNFQDLSSGPITSWLWDFGNGATSTLQNPSTTYFTPGTYTVRLTVSNGQTSNTLTRPQYITIYGKPAVNFIVSDSVACFPHPAQFTDLSAAAPGTSNVSWLWDFGDGTQSTDQNPAHVYTTSGNYSVTVKVTNDKGCYSVLTKPAYIKIAGGVIAGFTNTQPNNCRPPFNITFNNTTSGPGTMTWLWDFGDGNTSTLQNPVHTYVTPGDYSITLSATSSNGCTDTAVITNALQIQNIVTAFVVPDSVCINSNVTFMNTSTPPPDSISWTFGDGGIDSVLNPVKSYSAPGVYTIRLYHEYEYCADTSIKTITVLPRPTANFTAANTTKCEPNLTVNFQDQSVNAQSWLWDFGDGNTSTSQNPSHTYTAYGSFAVTLIVATAEGCTDTLVIPDFVQIRRPLNTFLNLPARGCVPFTINPIASVNTLDVITSFFWDFGDGNTSNSFNPTHTYVNQGTYTITLTVTTSTGCTDVFTLPAAITVGRIPIVNFSGAPTPVCAFQPVQFTDLTNEADEWLWVFGDGTVSTIQNPAHEYSDTGSMDVILYATNNGCRDSLRINDYIQVKPPIARFGYTTTCLYRLQFNFLDSSIGATSWFWDFGDGTTSTLQNPVHVFPGYSTYNVSLTVSNDTCSHTVTRQVRVISESPDFTTANTTACRQTTFTFSAIVSSPANIVDYHWDFGDGNVSHVATPNVNNYYVNSGWYTVTLITTDIYGCKDTTVKPNYIRINGPVANFSSTNASGCVGMTTTFNDLSTTDGISSIVDWTWDFGDGTIQSFSSSPFTHTYNTADTFIVKLTVTDAGGCKDTRTIGAFVKTSDPDVLFNSADTLTCPGANVNLTNWSTPINFTSYWDFGDGTSSTNFNASHSYGATGLYTVKLVITDPLGCRDSLILDDYIRVVLPVAAFTVNDSVSACTPFEVQFTNTSQNLWTHIWDLGGGMSTLMDPIQFYNTPGIYPVSLIVSSAGGCKDTASMNIQVIDTAGSMVTYVPLDGCKPLNVDLTVFSNGPVDAYTWDFGDGTLVQNVSPTISHIYNSFGNFVPKVILQDPGGCIIPITGLDTVRIKGATVKFGVDNRFYCDSGWVNFIDSTTFNDSLSTYSWDFGDGTTSSLQNPSHFYSSPGNYTVTLNVLTQNACVDTFRMTNAIKIVESPLISIGGDSVVCIHERLLHLGVFERPDTSLVRWAWNFPNGATSDQQFPVLQQYNTAGDFVVSTVATNSSGCKDTALKNILVNPLPTIDIPSSLTMQVGFPVLIPATYTSNVIDWSWQPSLTLTCPDCPQPIANPKFNTKYTVDFVDSNGCRNNGEIQIIVICKNGNVFVPNTFSPNGDGSNDLFYVRGRGLDRVKSLRVFNRWGEVVFEKANFPVNDATYGWDGKYKGNKPIADVYVYQVEVWCDNSEVIRFEGNIALIQ